MFLPTVLEVQFENSLYTVSESAGSIALCLLLDQTTTIASGVTVPLSVVELSAEPVGILSLLHASD